MGAAGFAEHGATLRKLRGSEAGHDVVGQQRGAIGGVHGHGDAVVGGHVTLPAKMGQVVGDAADRVSGIALQVDVAVAIHVHGVFVQAAGHELRQADRARVRALDERGLDTFARAHDEELFKLATEEVAAVLAAAGEIEGQRGQCVQGAKAAGDAAVEGLDTDDADDDFRRHAPAVLGFAQPGFVVAPEGHAGGHAPRFYKTCAVGGPVFGRAGRRRHHQLAHTLHAACLRQLQFEPGAWQTATLGDIVGKAQRPCVSCVVRVRLALGPGRLRQHRQAEQGQAHEQQGQTGATAGRWGGLQGTRPMP